MYTILLYKTQCRCSLSSLYKIQCRCSYIHIQRDGSFSDSRHNTHIHIHVHIIANIHIATYIFTSEHTYPHIYSHHNTHTHTAAAFSPIASLSEEFVHAFYNCADFHYVQVTHSTWKSTKNVAVVVTPDILVLPVKPQHVTLVRV